MAVDFSRGDLVLVKFPFGTHPAYVLYDNGDVDVLVCMITSTQRHEKEEIEILSGEGNIKHTSYIRTHKIASVSKNITGKAIIGKVSSDFAINVEEKLSSWLRLPPYAK
jgi:mRNA-degrading endonuclease toxin of MazEF toxin-antitoxin module